METNPDTQPNGRKAKAPRWIKWLVAIGPFIIFANYLIKEGLRENAKESRSSLEAAQVTFENLDTLRRIELEVHNVETNTAKPISAGQWNLSADFEDTAWLKAMYAKREAKCVLDLNSKLSASRSSKSDDIRKVYNELEIAESEGRPLPDKIKAIYRTVSLRSDAKPSKDELAGLIKIVKEMNGLMDKTSNAEKRLKQLREEVIGSAEADSKAAAASFQSYTNLSFGLYIVGFLLSLVGQVWGIETKHQE